MEFNTRVSQQYRLTNQRTTAKSNRQQQQKEQDEFILLSADEIAGCIDDIGVPFSPDDLWKPNPQQIQKVFELFAELLINATRETVEPAMQAAAEEVCGEYVECVPIDTRNLMGFYVSLRKLLIECGITDFSFADLLRPASERLVKIFSYIINFVRFRESHTATIDEHFNKAENTKARIESLYVDNQDMEVRLDDMKRERKTQEQQVKEKTRRNDELKQRLLELKKGQERVANRLERVRGEKSRLTEELEERTSKTVSMRADADKLRPYVLQSPSVLQASLAELSDTLSTTRTQTESLEKRTRALQTSSDTFSVVTQEVTSCCKVLEEINSEIHKEDEENIKAARRKDALSERSHNVREVEHTESILQKQLQRWLDRTETVRKGSKDRSAGAKERMEELRAEHRKLTDERTDRGREMEKRRVKIEQTEKKMADLKENIENEIHSAHDEYLKIDSHIKLYITEMEQSIH